MLAIHQVDGGLPGHSAVFAAAAGGPPRGADVGQVGVVAPQDTRHRAQGRQRRQDEVAGEIMPLSDEPIETERQT